ncbi:LOW QUALITY PROTEIN: hypothetical protein HID58_014190 [Brassica napus]|uniref:Tyrosine-protein kinase catalytic domain-containing protein n=1 Tax=Brassica napus TaxID=3708 RepID=A0ABQ8DIA5_BRANA|nr:LOW QUALITY PROTEIN: hypothetical protein HID58_014190 [Brassica napus]
MFSSFGARMNDVRREKWVFRYKYQCFEEEEEEEVTLPHFYPGTYQGVEILIKKINKLRSRDKRVSVKGGTLLSSRETFEAGQYPLHSSNGNLEIYDGKLVIGTTFIGAFPLLFRLTWNDQQISYLSITTTDNRSYTRGINHCPNGFCDDTLILNATDNFSQETDHGGFGYWCVCIVDHVGFVCVFIVLYGMYDQGVLANGEEIAVKKLSEISKQGLDEFRTEVRSISRLRHINIVRLYGWSVYKEEKLLIYVYLVNGSLKRGGELNWKTRFHIIKGVAQGLAYFEEGVFVLETVNGKKEQIIRLFHWPSSRLQLMCFVSLRNRKIEETETTIAWNKYNERNWSEIIDEKIRQDCVQSWQVLRCIEVGLLWCLIILQGTYQKSPWSWLYSKRKQLRFKKPKCPSFLPN